MIALFKQIKNVGSKSLSQSAIRQNLISSNPITHLGYFSKYSFTSLTQKFQDSYSRCKEELCQGSEFLRQYIAQLPQTDKKLSKKNYLTFKRNLNSAESVELLVQYLQPLTQNIQSLNSKRQKRVLKLILQAEKNLLKSTGTEFNHTKKILLDQNSIDNRIAAIKKYLSDSEVNKNVLLNNQIASASTIESFYALKSNVFNQHLKKLQSQSLVLGSFKTLTYLGIPTIFFVFPYASLFFLHPYAGETYYRFSLLSLRQNQYSGIFISLLLGGSLSLAFYKTYSDMYGYYEKKYVNTTQF